MNSDKKTLQECMADFATRTGLSRDLPASKRPPKVELTRMRTEIASAMGDVTAENVYRWFSSQERMPVHHAFIKVFVMIQSVGFNIYCHKANPIDEHRKGILRVLAFNLTTAEKLQEVGGYSHSSAIFDYVTGRNGMAREKVEKIAQVVDETMLKTALKMEQELGEKIRTIVKVSDFSPEIKLAPTVVPSNSSSIHIHPPKDLGVKHASNDPVERLARLIGEAIPVAEALATDTTPEGFRKREKLRQITTRRGSNGVFILANLLNPLCSEKALQTSRKNSN
jgi:hypothetical protein